MLVDPPIQNMLPKAECAYELAVLVSKRARQLVEGAQPMIDCEAPNMVSLACKEISTDKVICVRGDKSKEMVVPKTKAARDAEIAAMRAKEEAERNRQMYTTGMVTIIEEGASSVDEANFVPANDTEEIISDDVVEDVTEDVEEATDVNETEGEEA